MTKEHRKFKGLGGLHFDCEHCGQPLKRPGAILFSPPDPMRGLVRKHHICSECYRKISENLSYNNAMNTNK
jgi:hypothetical protein